MHINIMHAEITGAAFFIIAVAVILIYNSIVSSLNGVKRAWSDIIAYERLKDEVLPAAYKVAMEYKEFEGSLHRDVTRLRESLRRLDPKKLEPELLKETEHLSRRIQDAFTVAVENYPGLRASEVMQSLIEQISEKQGNVAAAITIYNQTVEQLNNRIQHFPNSIVNALFNRVPAMEIFNDSTASGHFEYRPNF